MTANLARALRTLAGVPARISVPVAEYVTRQLKADLRAGRDSYGTAHAPLRPLTVERKGHARILIESRALVDSLRAEPLPGAGVALRVDPPYARFHMTGARVRLFGSKRTARMPARPFLPHLGVLPDKWRAQIQRLYTQAVRQAMRAGR